MIDPMSETDKLIDHLKKENQALRYYKSKARFAYTKLQESHKKQSLEIERLKKSVDAWVQVAKERALSLSQLREKIRNYFNDMSAPFSDEIDPLRSIMKRIEKKNEQAL